jgi:hypothetical protein
VDLLNPTQAGSERSGHGAPHILIDLHAESQRDLLCKMREEPQLGLRRFMATTVSMSSLSLRAGATPTLRRKQHAVLSFPQLGCADAAR